MVPFHAPAGTADAIEAIGPGATVGSPMYDMDPTHGLAVAAVALLPVAVWLARRLGGRADRPDRRGL